MTSNLQTLSDKDVDFAQIDKLAKTNFSIRDRQLSEMLNMVRKAGNMFSFVSEAKIRVVAERLQEQGFGCVALKPTIEKIINDFDKFPTYKEILTLIRHNQPKEAVKEVKSETSLEDKRLIEVRKEFVEILGEDKIEDYVKWWIKNCFGLTVYEEFIDKPMIFEKPALFDWKDTGQTNNFNRIIDTFNRKALELKRKKL